MMSNARQMEESRFDLQHVAGGQSKQLPSLPVFSSAIQGVSFVVNFIFWFCLWFWGHWFWGQLHTFDSAEKPPIFENGA
jgi:hypothetical protein